MIFDLFLILELGTVVVIFVSSVIEDDAVVACFVGFSEGTGSDDAIVSTDLDRESNAPVTSALGCVVVFSLVVTIVRSPSIDDPSRLTSVLSTDFDEQKLVVTVTDSFDLEGIIVRTTLGFGTLIGILPMLLS